MPGRNYQGSGYRYGFNGKEKDPEGLGGGGSTYDYGFRIYNSNIGRFLSIDPLTSSYPWLSPYQFASNNPIFMIDVDGQEGLPYTHASDGGKFEAVLNSPQDIVLLKSSENGAALIIGVPILNEENYVTGYTEYYYVPEIRVYINSKGVEYEQGYNIKNGKEAFEKFTKKSGGEVRIEYLEKLMKQFPNLKWDAKVKMADNLIDAKYASDIYDYNNNKSSILENIMKNENEKWEFLLKQTGNFKLLQEYSNNEIEIKVVEEKIKLAKDNIKNHEENSPAVMNALPNSYLNQYKNELKQHEGTLKKLKNRQVEIKKKLDETLKSYD